MSNIFDRMTNSNIPAHETGDDVDVVAGPDSDPGDNAANSGKGGETISAELKAAVQELLKHGYLEEANRQGLFRRVVLHQAAIEKILEPLDFSLRVDSHRGIAFVVITPSDDDRSDEDDGWAHPLVRKQRMTLEQSLLVAILRQAFAIHEQESGVGQSVAKIAIDDLLPSFMVYLGDSGSDAKNESRLLQLLEQLKAYGIVSEVDANQEVVIRPLIAHLANPESLAALLRVLQEQRDTLANPGAVE
jgi:hypothetical protein